MSMISVSNLNFSYEGSYDTIFKNLSFQLDTNWRLGFIGRNGKGKTTFLKLLLKEYEYEGNISASVDFSYFPFEVAQMERTTLDVIDALCGNYEFWELQRELSLLEVAYEALDRPFKTLSQGERTKVLLAVLFLRENHFLLIDEPTNHLDMASRQLVGDYLKNKKGFILISHDRFFLDQCIDHVLSINKANIEVQRGNYTTWQANKDGQDAHEQSENDKLKKDIQHLTTAAKRTAQWSDRVEKTKCGVKNSGLRPDRGYIGHKAAKMMKHSKNAETRKEKALKEKSTLLKNIETEEALAIKTLNFPKNRLVEVQDLSLSYGHKKVFEGLSFDINQGDRIALKGRNGCGKSSVFKQLLGATIAQTGHLRMGSQLKCSYIAQDTDHLKGGLRNYLSEKKLDETLFKAILRKLGFSREQFEIKMEAYSSGQKKKVLLASSLCLPAHLYIWDEPLNFIDVLSRLQIETLILRHKPTMIFVEHDQVFVEKVATKIIEIKD